MAFRQILWCLCAATGLAACGGGDDGTLDIAVIGVEESVFDDGLRLSSGAQHVRAATDWGLVAFDAHGEVIPALAERWIVTEDGLSFIFRLREGSWPDGNERTAASARAALIEAIEGLEGTSLGRDLGVVTEIRAMAGRVIEIRLAHPEPYLLQLLAQPELALRQAGGGSGPMRAEREDTLTRFVFKPPLERGLPMEEDWEDDVLEVNLRLADAREAIALFDAGAVDVVIGGTLGNLPQVETGPLSSGTLRIDSTFGLFGLQVRSEEGMLGNDGVREGLAMAIDRAELLGEYNIGGWVPTSRPVSPGLPGDPGLVLERWQGQPIEQLRAEAAARISAWRRQFDAGDLSQPALVTVALGDAPGWDMLFRQLARQLAEIGVRLERTDDANEADLVMVDRVARYPAPRWFLNQFHCALRRGLCSEELDQLVDAAAKEGDPVLRAALMAQAEAQLTLANVYIPIGSPLRWSLVRGSVDGFEPNPYAFHPLPPMAERPR